MKNKKPQDDMPQGLTHNPFAALRPNGNGGGGNAASEKKDEPKTPAAPEATGAERLVLRREKTGRGGKTVTRIEGLAAPEAEEIMKRMKKALGCGASLDGADVLLQGSLVDRAAAWLEQNHGARIVKGN